MVLLISLVFLLLLTLIGLSSMQNATLQEKMAGSVKLRNESFQFAEAALRIGESAVQLLDHSSSTCSTVPTCAPPTDAINVTTAGPHVASGVTWVAVSGGFYAVQHFATTTNPVNVIPVVGAQEPQQWALYRITGVGVQGGSRTVLESVYGVNRRIMWRQLQ
jgi:type IV pilus assembly protein PilX